MGSPNGYIFTPWSKFKSGASSRGFRVMRNGDLCVARVYELANGSENVSVDIIGQDGQIKKRDLLKSLDSCRGAICGIGMDPAGNLFVGNNLRPKSVLYSDAFALANLPAPSMFWNSPAINHYAFFNGGIFKFPNTGGSFERKRSLSVASLPDGSLLGPVPELQPNGFYNMTVQVKNAVWQSLGFSPCPTPLGTGADDQTCHCVTGRFTVDDYGRVLVPEALNFQVAILDNNKNLMLKFGEYGNMDQQGPRSAHPTPEIPFGYPVGVQYAGRSVYVADMSNLRVVKANLDYATQWALAAGVVVHGPVSTTEVAAPGEAMTLEVFPMPFNPSTRIMLQGPAGFKKMTLAIHDIHGKRMNQWTLDAGAMRAGVLWNGHDHNGRKIGSGLYIARITAEGRTWNRSLIFVK